MWANALWISSSSASSAPRVEEGAGSDTSLAAHRLKPRLGMSSVKHRMRVVWKRASVVEAEAAAVDGTQRISSPWMSRNTLNRDLEGPCTWEGEGEGEGKRAQREAANTRGTPTPTPQGHTFTHAHTAHSIITHREHTCMHVLVGEVHTWITSAEGVSGHRNKRGWG